MAARLCGFESRCYRRNRSAERNEALIPRPTTLRGESASGLNRERGFESHWTSSGVHRLADKTPARIQELQYQAERGVNG